VVGEGYPAAVRVAWQEWGHVVVATLALLPLAAAVVVALVRWRTRSGTTAAVAWRHSVAEVGLLVGTAPWLWMVLTPRAGAGEVRPVPLRDLAGQLAGDPGVAVAQVGGNLLVFAACGALAPLRFPVLARLPVLVGVVAAGSLAVETLQYALVLGRVSSADDVLLNTAGAALAGLATRRWWRGRPAGRGPDRRAGPGTAGRATG
jgi:hypothetical protein